MGFNWETAVVAGLFFLAFSEMVAIRKLTQNLSDKIDSLDALMISIRDDAASAAMDASEANHGAQKLLEIVSPLQ